VILKQLFDVGHGNASGTTLSGAFRRFFDCLPRTARNRTQRDCAAVLDSKRQRRTCERTKPPLRQVAIKTERNFWEIKLSHRPKPFWYPYHTLRNVGVVEQLLASAGLDLLQLCRGRHGKIADIGAADGDLAFFLEKMGLSVDLIDNEPTNFNHLEGARILKEALHSNVTIRTVDLDSQFTLSGEKYDAIFLLGVLYHLKNPFFVLEKLAAIARYCFLSTRIARQTDNGQSISQAPIAYLLGPQECNNDSTNFWIFSDEGLKRLIERSGWNILAYTTIGNTSNSTPADPNHDERAFCVLKSNAILDLSAFPNPVPVGEGMGRTTILWSTANGSPGKVYVSINGQQEALFAAGRQGIATANWIQIGSTYEFRLYDEDRSKLLASVAVTRVPLQGSQKELPLVVAPAH
jgi:tRNA (mo5U34)-methyltransferase